MNYEAKVTDLSGAESVLIDDVELDGSRQSRRRLLIALAIVVALLIGGALLYFGSGEEAPFQPQQGNQVPTVSVVAPGRTTLAGLISATRTSAWRNRRAMWQTSGVLPVPPVVKLPTETTGTPAS